MLDPYKVLGITANATDAQIKDAYRALAKKYHPDNYSGSPLADLATEKMKEINEAYDMIISQRKRRTANEQTPSSSSYSQPGYSYENTSQNSGFSDVRNLIIAGRIADAEQILDGILPEGRSAEWYFLKGTVLYKRGWLEEAYNHFVHASQMDPMNVEYRAAMNQVTNQRNGVYGGYNPNVRTYDNCSACDICSTLWCADCCCECFGGDFISCC